MAVKHNIKYNKELRSTLPIENAQKNTIFDDYSEEICLAIDENNNESNGENIDQKQKC